MNDFTKEELKELYCRLTGQPGSPSFENEDLAVLGNKIKYMIEDYCEHEWDYDQHHKRGNCLKCGVR